MLLKLSLLFIIPAYAMAQVNLKPYNQTAAILFSLSDANKDGILTRGEMDSNFRVTVLLVVLCCVCVCGGKKKGVGEYVLFCFAVFPPFLNGVIVFSSRVENSVTTFFFAGLFPPV